ncbi:MAG: Na+/H+ antiporter subunit E [Hyphomicrobiaceae bacterium]
MRKASLFVALLVFWLALSGHYTLFLTTIGVLVSALCVVIAGRMQVDDTEGHPAWLLPAAVTYWPWLIWEICKSAWSVTKIVLDPELPISPTMTRVFASQKTTVGVATYANSITLTPGTITTEVNGNYLTIHALVRDGADDLEGGGMDARVTRFEGKA